MNVALDTIFQSLSDRTRREILHSLCSEELSVSEIANQYDISMPAISKHLQNLEQAELIIRRRDGKRHFISSNPNKLQMVDEWMGYYRKFWTEGFVRLGSYLDTILT